MSNIIILYGLPCAGKSTISEMLMKDINCNQINIDDIWKKLFSNPKYTTEESQIVFNEMLLQIQACLLNKVETLLLEGVFASISRLNIIQEIAKQNNYSLISILLFNSIENLIAIDQRRNITSGHLITADSLINLNKKFNSREFCSIAINTSKVSIKQTTNLIRALLSNGK